MSILCKKCTAVRSCQKPSVEGSFSLIIEGMLQEGSMPPGDVLDVGANTGEMTCFYACNSPSRTIHAIDPSHNLIKNIRCQRSGNIIKKVMTLARDKNENGQVSTIDEYFSKRSTGFLHMDVEGDELNLLQGGVRVITRDRPVFSVEVHYLESKQTYGGVTALLSHIRSLNYSAYIIHEVCGWKIDCRNILCFPNERMSALAHSPILSIATRSGMLTRIDRLNIKDYVTQSPLYDFYDSSEIPTLLRSKDAMYVCNNKSKKWLQDKPCTYLLSGEGAYVPLRHTDQFF